MHIIKYGDYTYHFVKKYQWELNSLFSNTILKIGHFLESQLWKKKYINQEVYWGKYSLSVHIIQSSYEGTSSKVSLTKIK